jgi:transposase
MVIVGIDAHKRTHTAVAIDEAGRRLGTKTTTSTTSEANLELVRWTEAFGADRRFAVEDCRHLSRRLEADLLAAGQVIVRVPPKLMAHARDAARTYGKSDPIDALAVARAALREPDLPLARLDGPSRELRLLVDHREDLVRDRTGQINRLRWHLHELDPAWDPAPRSLDRFVQLDAVAVRLSGIEGTLAWVAHDLVARIREVTVTIRELERRIVRLVASLAPRLLAMPGIGALTAAKILAEVADVRRFRSKDAFCPSQRDGTASGVVCERDPASAVPDRQPTVERRDPPDRRDPDADPRRREGVPRAKDRDGQHQDRGDQGPQAQAVRRRLSSTARRRGSLIDGFPRRGGLT